MKKYLIVVLCVMVLTLSGCSKKVEEKNILKTNAENKVMILGNATDDFNKVNWSAFESVDRKSSFEESEIKGVKNGENIVDAYTKENKIYVVVEDNSGQMTYKAFKNGQISSLVSKEEALDEGVPSKLQDTDEFWGFKRQGAYLAVIKDSGTDIYKNDIKLFELDGVVSIGDVDNNGTLEIIQRNSDGSKLTIYEIIDDKLIEVWKYNVNSESFHGDIQIGDLNQDGVKEIYLNDINGGLQKFILSEKGFSQDFNLPIAKKGYEKGSFFILDINGDSKMDVIIQKENLKPLMFIQK